MVTTAVTQCAGPHIPPVICHWCPSSHGIAIVVEVGDAKAKDVEGPSQGHKTSELKSEHRLPTVVLLVMDFWGPGYPVMTSSPISSPCMHTER